ncbi:zf-HC2 domain-containing protein [Streptomyces albireticuli]|uniref:zf-HC2 domain-containing protein n=1 Tax=Streptomyces albireticuli TaxID=1940 RepID=UPI00367BBF5F
MTGSGGQSPAELHLGDRLAALVDGELGHDSRERVLAHLATCCKCKAEADAQRRLKSVFAEAAPPPLSEGFLARLQSLPAAGLDGDLEGRPGAVDADGRWDASRGPGRPGGSAFGESFSLIPAAVAPHRDRPRDRGFRVHAVPDAPRGSRSRRFAFAAAGAVSLAAFALGGAQPLASVAEAPGARAEDPRATATPLARTTGGVRDDGRLLPLGFTAAVRPAPAAPSPPGVSLLRPSTAAPLPPSARAALPGPGGPTAGSAR